MLNEQKTVSNIVHRLIHHINANWLKGMDSIAET